ncbi:MAG: biopolymer transporter ExbD [Planctomycetaceae bacterium]
MPIQFRCPVCRKKLSIAERKAGAQVKCPVCSAEIRVPRKQDEEGADSAAERAGSAQVGVERQAEADPTPHLVADDDDEIGFRLSRRHMEDDGIDMTPMVDVTFLLLIFFMITASFSLQKSMETEAPEEDQEGYAQLPQMQDLAAESVIVEIDDSDVIFVDDERVGGPGELQDVLLRKMSVEQKREMIIEPHEQSRHGTVVAVTDVGIEVGMQRIRRVFKNEP